MNPQIEIWRKGAKTSVGTLDFEDSFFSKNDQPPELKRMVPDCRVRVLMNIHRSSVGEDPEVFPAKFATSEEDVQGLIRELDTRIIGEEADVLGRQPQTDHVDKAC